MVDPVLLRPWWLLALPLGLAVLWSVRRRLDSGEQWKRVCDAPLLRHLLVGVVSREGRGATTLAVTCLALATVALAGPSFRAAERAVYRPLDARVIVLDLSRSMDAGDLSPSRLVRARLKVADLLRLAPEGQTGLVVFAGDAFVVSPLTQDVNTLLNLLPALDTGVMPWPGSRPDLALERAGALLEGGSTSGGHVILVTDGEADGRTASAASDLATRGFKVSVYTVGTARGAPIPQPGGGFLKDGDGNIVVAKLRKHSLAEVARVGGGHLVGITADDTDVARLLERGGTDTWNTRAEATDRTATVRKDEGPWLVLALLPLAALAFRRGWLLALALCIPLAPSDAWAFEWSKVWLRADQQAYRALRDGRHEEAARVAEDERLRGAALYRAQSFEPAAEALEGLEDADSNYNRGNALARAGKLREALAAYDRALEVNAGMEDAAHNRALVESLLEQTRPPPRQGEPGEGENGDDESPRGEQRAQDGAGRDDRDQNPQGAPGEGESESSQTTSADSEAGAEPGSDGPSATPSRGNGEEKHDAGASGESEEDSPQARSTQPDASEATGAVPMDEETRQAMDQWLRQIPDDPGGLLRRKFAYEHRRRGTRPDVGEVTW